MIRVRSSRVAECRERRIYLVTSTVSNDDGDGADSCDLNNGGDSEAIEVEAADGQVAVERGVRVRGEGAGHGAVAGESGMAGEGHGEVGDDQPSERREHAEATEGHGGDAKAMEIELVDIPSAPVVTFDMRGKMEKLVPRVLKYCNRGFALPTAWQRPFVREVIESALRSDELPSLRFQLKRLRSLLSQEASCRCALARQHTHATFVAT